ncbi:1-deoxy-D-xylulose-5-phosphate synthase [Haloimpatiens lingqiaonensis]|uniref:1-deoxy-D-xylulose-5-phosphate synthase n=1 Tax=Haloimpatiens lingqiaonensis TaxID=1380675 RepID=UPI0010FDEA62|nr:1-deoxy-D-xylulose-5-phosphate synthase [Haloimpatiens lingqiaonensis]
MGNLLKNYKDMQQIKKMSFEDLDIFAKEIREFLIEEVSKTGGHLASNLGVVELTLSLYKVFNFQKDKLIWDVGHQAYVHKILTGRKDDFKSLRQYDGMSGFPKRKESPYDVFEVGHSSTSISAAIGMARVRDLNSENYEVIPVIGDGALTGGMALEALNDLGYSKNKVIIILNDNQMSIDKNVGGLSTYLSTIRTDPKYNKFKSDFNSTIRKMPLGEGVANSIQKLKDGIKQLVVPGMLFEDMGIKYLGPVDGHNIKQMVKILSMCKNINGPVLIHVITKKGKGYTYAESYPNKFHGIGPFDWKTGKSLSSGKITYSKVFGDEMVKIAEKNKKVVAITAAMPDGTGLKEFSQKYPKRFFDVGIAEQHAVTMAAGIASGGFKPVFAVYSTFLQRAYDQVLHDVCMQNLPVVFAIDRAGIVGNDGETHQGVFDISFLSHIPNLTIMSPKSTEELRAILNWSIKQNFPIAIRYPRGGDDGEPLKPVENIKLGKWEVLKDEGDIAIIATGNMVEKALKVREKLYDFGIKVSVVNGYFIKPMDEMLLEDLAQRKKYIFTIEDNVVSGGFGSNILNYLNKINKKVDIVNIGYKDEFIPHGDTKTLYKVNDMDIEGMVQTILRTVN